MNLFGEKIMERENIATLPELVELLNEAYEESPDASPGSLPTLEDLATLMTAPQGERPSLDPTFCAFLQFGTRHLRRGCR